MTVTETDSAYRARHEAPSGPKAPSRERSLQRRATVPGALLLIGLVHTVNINGWPSFSDDEGTYVAQAWAVFHGHLAHYTYWYDHPPVGWLQLAAFMGLVRPFGLDANVVLGRYIMVLYVLATAALIYRLCRNLGLHRNTALAGMLVWGLSPLVVFEGRQVMLDNIALPWVIGAFVLVSDRRRSLPYHIAAGLSFGIAVLTKETMVLLAPALLLLLWRCAFRPTRMFSLVGMAVTAGIVGCLYPLYAVLKYELLSGPGHVSLEDAVAFQLVSRAGSGNVLDSSSGARGIVDSWLFYDSVLPVAGVLAGFLCLAIPKMRAIGVGVALLVAIALRPNGYMPGMFIIGVLPFAAVAIAGVAEAVAARVRTVRMKGYPVGVLSLAVGFTLACGFVAPRWIDKGLTAWSEDANDAYYASLDYMSRHLDRRTRILADDTYWTSLVNHGWNADGWDGPIWYTKLDLDPIARHTTLEDGWRSVDYLLISEAMMRSSHGLAQLPQLKAAYDHSAVVQQWGTGTRQLQLRRIRPPQAPQDAPGNEQQGGAP